MKDERRMAYIHGTMNKMECDDKDCLDRGTRKCGDHVYQKLQDEANRIPLLNCVRQSNATVTRIVNSWELYTYEGCRGLQVPALYMMDGHAPTYTNPKLGGKFKDVHMHWTRLRTHPLLIDYNQIFGSMDYSFRNVQAVNELFLKEEADIWLSWMNKIYPEENTKMYQIQYPVPLNVDYIPMCCVHSKGGSFIAFDVRWTQDWIVSYWCNIEECELLEPMVWDEKKV